MQEGGVLGGPGCTVAQVLGPHASGEAALATKPPDSVGVCMSELCNFLLCVVVVLSRE